MRSRKRYEKWDFLGHSFFTTDLLREPKLTLDIVNLTGLNKDYAILIEGGSKSDKGNGDRNRDDVSGQGVLQPRFNPFTFSVGIDFIMAAKINKQIRGILEEHKRRKGITPAIFNF